MTARALTCGVAAGLALLAGRAAASPNLQLLTTAPVGTSPLLSAPYSADFTPSFLVSTDGDPTLPWLIQVKSPFTPATASVQRVGAVGLSPTVLSPLWVTVQTDPHPNTAIAVMSDGYAYRVNPVTGGCLWKTYLGRTTATTIHFPGCAGGVPASEIQCPNESGTAVVQPAGVDPKNPMGLGPATDNLVIIPTAYDTVATGDDPDACGTTSGNRVYALNLGTGAPAWVFNVNPTSPTPYAVDPNPPYRMAATVGSPWTDFWDTCDSTTRGQILVGTVDPGTGQDTLFAISALPATAGKLNWSFAAGDIQAALVQDWWAGSSGLPQGIPAACGHLYATTAADGQFETIGLTARACKGGPFPCLLSSFNLFPLTPQMGDMSWLYPATGAWWRVALADQSTIYIVGDNGPTTSLYCSSVSLQSTFPVVTSGVATLGHAVAMGMSDRNGNGALVELEIPPTAPPAPYDCGKSFVSVPMPGSVGPNVLTSVDPLTGSRALFTSVATPDGTSAVIATLDPNE